MIFLGIDPGLTGAIAAISPKGQVIVSLVPTRLTIKGKKKKREYDKTSMAALISNLGYEGLNERRFVTLEHQHAFPKQGSVSTGSIMRGFGIWEGILVGLGIEHIIVSSRKWQKEVAPAKKGESKIRAIETATKLFPDVPLRISQRSKKDHTGFADALCLAEYGRRLKNA